MYTYFAKIYDNFIEINYKEWANFIVEIIKQRVPQANLVLDLACGTGNITTLLKCYDVIALDSSTDMLMIAREKAMLLNQNILFLNQRMQNFELYGTVDVIICTCDSINYILNENEVTKTFLLVKNYLNVGGIFIFDIKTLHKYKNVLANNTFGQTKEDSAIIWENYYDITTSINEYYLTMFLKKEDGNYIKNEETHYQKAYTKESIISLISSAELTLLNIYDGYTKSEPNKNSERLVFVVQKE